MILAGVKSVGLLDHTPVAISDLGAQFYLTAGDVGKERALVSHPQLQSLNPYVNTHVVEEAMSVELLASGRYQIVVLTDSSLADAVKYNEYCHAHGIKFLWAEVPGVYASLFVDFPGPVAGSAEADQQMGAKGHFVTDLTGEQPARGLLAHVSSGNPGVVTVHEDSRHGLQDGDYVTFEEVQGMTELNVGHSEARPVKVRKNGRRVRVCVAFFSLFSLSDSDSGSDSGTACAASPTPWARRLSLCRPRRSAPLRTNITYGFHVPPKPKQ